MDIVERLRQAESVKDYFGDWELYKEAANEIERLRGALQYIVENDWKYTENGKSFGFLSKIAHAALKEDE